MKNWDRYQTTFHSIINFGFQIQHNFPNIRTNFPWEILSGPCLYLVHIENKNQEIYFDLFLILGIPAKPKAMELVNTWAVTENSGQGGFTVISPSNWPNMSQTWHIEHIELPYSQAHIVSSANSWQYGF